VTDYLGVFLTILLGKPLFFEWLMTLHKQNESYEQMWYCLSPDISVLLSCDFLCNLIDWHMAVFLFVALFKYCNHYGHSKHTLGSFMQWAKLTNVVKG